MHKCSKCGKQETVYFGKCPGCGSWGTLVEVAGKKKKSGLKNSRANITKRRKKLSSPFRDKMELFDYVWRNRKHVSEVSGNALLPRDHALWHWQFAHVLNVLRYPLYELNPDNIMLMLPNEHTNQDKFEAFKKKQEELTRKYYSEYYGKEYVE